MSETSGKAVEAEEKALDAKPHWRPSAASWGVRSIFIAFALGGMLMVLAAWELPPFTASSERTEDAYVQGHTTVIASQVSGYVQRIMVDDFDEVGQGKVLVELDPRTLDQDVEQKDASLEARRGEMANNIQRLRQSEAQVRQLRAELASARAAFGKSESDARRSAALVSDGSLSKREDETNAATLRQATAHMGSVRAQIDSALAAVEAVRVNEAVLKANVAAASAQLDAARVNRGYATLRAPQGGSVSEVGVRLGQYVAAGAPMMFVVPTERWIVANYKESQTHNMLSGQHGWATVDALGHAKVSGSVDRISPATSAQFSALKPDNASGNFTKISQRIAVRIKLDEGQAIISRLRPGMSVEMHIDVGDNLTSR